ncbi:hypothetical protein N779_24485 [Vibrio coralliilyticus OCN008]|nr:hypothetical protein N779_24485 [Vibrio coralliilyticus OCN008]
MKEQIIIVLYAKQKVLVFTRPAFCDNLRHEFAQAFQI